MTEVGACARLERVGFGDPGGRRCRRSWSSRSTARGSPRGRSRARFRSQLCYFIGSPGSPRLPALGEDEFWFDRVEVERWLDDGVFYLVSPLDTANMTEVELSEEQEDFLNWLKSTDVRHVRGRVEAKKSDTSRPALCTTRDPSRRADLLRPARR